MSSQRVNLVALGWSLCVTLAVLFVVCLAVALIVPDWRLSHGWIDLFSAAPMTSFRVWVDGIVFSLVFGWITAIVFGWIYNRLIER
jgi:riboflavin transporter FmnP